MHIKDGSVDPAIAIIMFAAAIILLVISWKKVKAQYTQSFAAVLAISSAFVFAAQMIDFPVALGTSGHLVGGTFLAMLLGPFAAMISMTIVVIMQGFFFADGGISTLGANIFNMAITCSLGFLLIKLLTRSAKGTGEFASRVFIASWISVMVGALAAALEVGFSSVAASAGGVWGIVPALLGFYAVAGLVEGAVTAALLTSLQRFQPAIMVGLNLLKTSVSVKQ
jgi:cobalt/nickel transport system permease protein